MTGGCGRVGRGVVALAVERGHHVVSIDRVPPSELPIGVDFVALDVTDYNSLRNAIDGCEGLIHLAAITAPDTQPDHVVHNQNVAGSYNALRAAVETGIGHICQASSINAIGAAFSRRPRFDYFPLDERHPTYAEDPYSLSKWIAEQQADAIARRFEAVTIGSLRFHWVTEERPHLADYPQINQEALARNLWSFTRLEAAARACLAVLEADYRGHEVFFITAPITVSDEPSRSLSRRWYPQTEIHGDFGANCSFYDNSKAERLLGWRHDLFA
ncbi:MAG: NAD(P)-dependent oxidoreductase [Oscillochloris sp.]|nr:NAD(P)-dependent oxidoreductase [Oscillochloris sp.]